MNHKFESAHPFLLSSLSIRYKGDRIQPGSAVGSSSSTKVFPSEFIVHMRYHRKMMFFFPISSKFLSLESNVFGLAISLDGMCAHNGAHRSSVIEIKTKSFSPEEYSSVARWRRRKSFIQKTNVHRYKVCANVIRINLLRSELGHKIKYILIKHKSSSLREFITCLLFSDAHFSLKYFPIHMPFTKWAKRSKPIPWAPNCLN